MPAPRINMRKLKDALRLKLEGGRSHQQIATSLGISKGVVTKYVGLAVAAGLDWPAVQALDEAALERRLLAASQPATSYARPDYGRIHQELRRKGVTLMLLWEEHCAQVSDEHDPAHPLKPWRYSQFCENYRQFAKRLKRSMRQVHRAGEKLFIDYAGPTIALTDGGRANIFVAALGAVAACSSVRAIRCCEQKPEPARSSKGAWATAQAVLKGRSMLYSLSRALCWLPGRRSSRPVRSIGSPWNRSAGARWGWWARHASPRLGVQSAACKRLRRLRSRSCPRSAW